MSDDQNRLDGLAAIGMAAARAREPVSTETPQRAEPLQVLGTAELECYDGASQWNRDTVENDGTVTRVRREHVLDRFDPFEYEPTQPGTIRVLHRHDRGRPVGHVEHLEWGAGSPARILAVFSIDEAEAEFWGARAVYISPGTKRNARGRLVLDHIALVESTARIAASPVKWAGTDYSGRSRWTRQSTPGFDLLVRAHDGRRKRAKDRGLPIVGHPGFDEPAEEHRSGRITAADPLTPEYMRRNGEGGLFYSGGIGKILDVR